MAEQDETIGNESLSATALPHFNSLDSIRGLAAMMVVICHVPWSNPTIAWPIVRHAYLMVDIFFVLSGFVIFYAYSSKIGTPRAAARFIWLRFWRVYPLHFIFLIVFLLFEVAKWLGTRHGLYAYNAAFLKNNFAAFLANLFFGSGVGRMA